MKKKLSIIITALMLVVVVALGIVLPIALEDDSIYYKISYSRLNSTPEFPMSNTNVQLLNSLDELKEFCDTYNNSAFDDSKWNYSSELNQKIREYDDKYFENKSLVIFRAGFPRIGYEILIKNVKVNKETGTMVLDIIKIDYVGGLDIGGLDSLCEWVTLIEVNKKDVSGVKTVEYTIEETKIDIG